MVAALLTSADIKRQALALGFDLCGVAPAGNFAELGALVPWLRRGFAGTMTYLNRTARVRSNVRQLLPSARSVVSVACRYDVERPYSTQIRDPSEALIARYAWGDDYHEGVGRRLDDLLEWMGREGGVGFEGRRYVDAGPVQERVYAQHAGLGWIGRNTCVISPELGSWILLGEIVCNLALEPDAPGLDRCGNCTLCLQACPTGALVEPHVLDARRCISYLTIEFKGTIPDIQRGDLGAHVFGCDICQEVCPWNEAAPKTASREWMPRDGLDRPALVDLWLMSDTELAALQDGSAVSRQSVAGLRRNIALALGNTRDPAIAPALAPVELARRSEESPSLADPLVTTHAAWAFTRLMHHRPLAT